MELEQAKKLIAEVLSNQKLTIQEHQTVQLAFKAILDATIIEIPKPEEKKD